MSESGAKQDRPPVPEITPEELRDRLAHEHPIVLLDVREPFERDIADLPGDAQLRIPMAELLSRLDELDREANTVVYCRSGARSNWVVQRLQENGFTKAMNLAGGIMRWREAIDPSLTEY